MIIESNLRKEGFGYAQLVLAAYHTDDMAIDTEGCTGYTRVESLWNSDMQHTGEQLGVPEATHLQAFDLLYPGLRERLFAGKVNEDYNNDPDELHEMWVWKVQGSGEDLLQIWANLFNAVASGPLGGDDTTFDYWPSAWGVMLHMAEDLIELGVAEGSILKSCQRAWDKVAGRYEDWDFAGEVASRPVLVDTANKG